MSRKELDAFLRKAAALLFEWFAVVGLTLMIGYVVFIALDGKAGMIGDRVVITFRAPGN